MTRGAMLGGGVRPGRAEMPLAGLGAPAYDRAPMTSLTRYILRQCFGVMIFVTAALSAAVWLAQSLRLIDLIVNRGLVDRGVPLSGGADPAALSRHRAADRRVHRGAVHLQPADRGERARGHARGGTEPAGAGQAGADPGRDRLCLSDEPVALFAAGGEPRVQGSAVRDPQPVRLEPDPGGHLHDGLRQADLLYPQPRRARRCRRAADQRQPRPAAPGHDPRRARRLCRHRRPARASSWSTATASNSTRRRASSRS